MFPTSGRTFLPNPPDPREGITLHRRFRGRWYWLRLDERDEISQAQAGSLLCVSRMQVNRWVRGGQLKDRKVLGTSRITVSEVLRFALQKRINLRPRGRWLV